MHASGKLSANDVPEDVWLFVIQLLRDSAEPTGAIQALTAISASCRRMRLLAVPYIFRSVELVSESKMDKFRDVIRSSPHCADYIRELTLSSVPCRQSADEEKRLARIDDLILLAKRISKNLIKFELLLQNVLESRSQLRLKDSLPEFFRYAKQIRIRHSCEKPFDLADLMHYVGNASSASTLRLEHLNVRSIIFDPEICSNFWLSTGLETLVLRGNLPAQYISDRIARLTYLRSLTVDFMPLGPTDVTFLVNAVCAIADSLSTLQLSTSARPGHEMAVGQIWKSEIPRMLGACSRLTVLALHFRGSEGYCDADLVHRIPVTHLKSLHLKNDIFASPDTDISRYEEFCSAVINMQKTAVHLNDLQIAHNFSVPNPDRDRQIEDQLEANMPTGNFTFECALPPPSPLEEELEEEEDEEEISDDSSQSDGVEHEIDGW